MKRDYEKEIAMVLRGTQHFDAGETDFIVRQLLAIKPKLYSVEYPTLKAMDFIPMASDVDAYAEAITYQMTDGYGAAKFLANDADDLPDVDVTTGEAAPTPVKTIGAQYGYSWLDLQRAAKQRAPLTTRRAERARKSIAEQIDVALRAGNADAKIVGFLTSSLITPTAAVGNYGAQTPAAIVTDINTNLNAIPTNTKGVHEATAVLLPISTKLYLETTPWSTTGQSDLTIMDFIRKSHPGVSFDSWYALETAGAGGVKRMVVYDKNPDVVEGQLPLGFYEFPPQAKGLRLNVPCIARCGGTIVRFPAAMRYVDGV